MLAQIEGAPLITIQAHNSNLTLSIAIRKAIADKFKVTRSSPLNDGIKVFTELGTIEHSPGAVSEQIAWMPKVKGDRARLGHLPRRNRAATALMNNVIDAAQRNRPRHRKSPKRQAKVMFCFRWVLAKSQN